jgi:cytochrome c oxidase subunit 2
MAFEQRICRAEFRQNLVIGHHFPSALGRVRRTFNSSGNSSGNAPAPSWMQALEAPESRAYRARKPAARTRASDSNMLSGVQMKRIGWAIALAAAWLTPAAAQAPASAPPTSTASSAPAAAQPNATPPGGFAQNPNAPEAATASPAQEPVTLLAPTPGVGQPDGRMGLQDQVSPIGLEAAGFHDNILLPLCALISVIVLALLLWVIVRYRRGANQVPSRNSHNTAIEVIWTLIPVLILVAIAIPSIRLLRHQYTPPPADVTVKVTGHQWYWSYEYPDLGVSFDSYMLKEANDPTRQKNQRARTAADGPPLLAVDERLVIPQGKIVKFIVTADDVIHSFAIPAMWVKQDANPGQLNETWAGPINRTGVYFGQCSELCGARHGFMPIAVEVVPQAQFDAWVASKGGHMPTPKGAGGVSPAPQTGAGMSKPAPAVAGTETVNPAPAPPTPNVANRTTH